jgi:hypothetical protein
MGGLEQFLRRKNIDCQFGLGRNSGFPDFRISGWDFWITLEKALFDFFLNFSFPRENSYCHLWAEPELIPAGRPCGNANDNFQKPESRPAGNAVRT